MQKPQSQISSINKYYSFIYLSIVQFYKRFKFVNIFSNQRSQAKEKPILILVFEECNYKEIIIF